MTTPTITVLAVTVRSYWTAEPGTTPSRSIIADLTIGDDLACYVRSTTGGDGVTCRTQDGDEYTLHPSLLPLVEKAVTEALGRAALAGVR